MSVQRLAVAADEAGMRLDRWFRARFPALAFSRLQKMVRTGQVRVDGGRVKASTRLEAGQEVRVPPLGEDERGPAPPRPAAAVRPEDRRALEAMILYEDEALIAVNKPPGLAAQGGAGTERHLDRLLEARRDDPGGKPRLAHRLDRDTSGLLLLGKTAAAARALAASFKGRGVEKLYWALVRGKPERRGGVIDLPLRKADLKGREQMVVDADAGKSARTGFRVIAGAGRIGAWVGLAPETGRTHQLRVHCAAIGCPILGDRKYGALGKTEKGDNAPPGLMLHAAALSFAHPMSKKRLELEAPPPPSFEAGLDWLGLRPEGQEGSLLSHWRDED